MKKSTILIFILAASLLLLSGCADNQTIAQGCLQGHQYGFWGGLWHGIVMPFSFIGQLFSDDIAVWAPNNNGGWYTFGFVLGAGGLLGGRWRWKSSN